jgi:hypothetical protein
MNLEIQKKMQESRHWIPAEEKGYYINSIDDKRICWLKMNNFPEEQMWTFFYKGESIDFDDLPSNWIITYDS